MALMHYQRSEREKLFLNSVSCLYSIDKSANFWSVVEGLEACLKTNGFVLDKEKSMTEVHVFSFNKTSLLVSASAVALMSPVQNSADLNEFLHINEIVISAFEKTAFDGVETVACVRYHSIKVNIKEIGITKEEVCKVVFSKEMQNKVRLGERDDYYSVAQLGDKEDDGILEYSLAITSSKKGDCKLNQLRAVINSLSEIEYDMWRSSITEEMYSKVCV